MHTKVIYGPTSASDTLRFLEAVTVRVMAGTVSVTGKRRSMTAWQFGVLNFIYNAIIIVLFLSMSSMGVSAYVPLLLMLVGGHLWLTRGYTHPKERTLTVPGGDITDVACAGCEVSFRVRQGRGAAWGVMQAATPEMAALLAQALRGEAEGVFAATCGAVTQQAAGRCGKVLVTPDQIQLEGFFLPESMGSARSQSWLLGVPPETARKYMFLTIGVLGVALVVAMIGVYLVAVLNPGSSFGISMIWLPMSAIMIIMGLCVGVAMVRARLFRTATVSKFAITDLACDGRDISFSAPLAEDEAGVPERFAFHAATEAQASKMLQALATFDASGQFPVTFGPSALAVTVGLAGTGSMAITADAVKLSGRRVIDQQMHQIGILLGGGAAVVGLVLLDPLTQSGLYLVAIFGTYAVFMLVAWLWPKRLSVPRAAIRDVDHAGRQVAFTMQTTKGPRRVVLHTARVDEAGAIAGALTAREGVASYD